jgi:hypothetical protein
MAGIFWRSFFDGLTGEGIFGDLEISDAPTGIFKFEPTVADLLGQLKQASVGGNLTPQDLEFIRELYRSGTTRAAAHSVSTPNATRVRRAAD